MRPVNPADGNPAPDLVPRREVLDLSAYVPGKPPLLLESELGVRGAIKLASNESPLGPSPRAVAAIAAGLRDLNRYPEGTSLALRRALAARHGVEPEQIVVGSGSNEIIELLAHILLGPGDQAVIADPTFPMYFPAIRITGGEAVRVPVRDLRHDLEAMAAAIGPRTRLVFVCNPNNPTGTMVTAAEVERFMELVPRGVVVVFDEAYHEYVQHPDYPRTLAYVTAQKPVAILRTFSKIYSLAGLRVGYAITRPDLASLLHRVRMPFNVSTLGQAAALASLDDPHQVERAVSINEDGKRHLTAALSALGCVVVPSEANFLLVRLPCPSVPIAAALERTGVIVRPMATFRLSAEYVRISVGLQPENERLVAALGTALGTPVAGGSPLAPDAADISGAAPVPPAPRPISA
jgi:histidinol-phosphate aminotransferase